MNLIVLFTDDISENFIKYSDLEFLTRLVSTSKIIEKTVLYYINNKLCHINDIIECESFLEYSIFLSTKILTPISVNVCSDVQYNALMVKYKDVTFKDYEIFNVADYFYHQGDIISLDNIISVSAATTPSEEKSLII